MPDAAVRVVHVITRMILGGAQESTLAICDGLRRRPGWDVTLVTGPPIGPEGELLGEVGRRGLPCHLVPQLRRAVNPARDSLAFRHLFRLFRRLRPAIVHTHSSKAGILGRFAARAAGVRVIIHTVRGLPFHPYQGRLTNAAYIGLERAAAGVTTHYSAVAQAMVDGAVAAGIAAPERFTVIRSGIDVDAYADCAAHREATRRRFGFAQQDVVIGKVARLFDLKGHRFLIDAAPAILGRCPQAKFLFVGDGVLHEALEARARALGVSERFVFAGLVPPEQVPACISGMDVLVHASLHEGLARVLVQGLLCEKPVVTFALDGAPEVIIDGVTGRLATAGSVGGLARAVIRTLQDYPGAVDMAREGRRRFADEFRIETAVARMEALYRRLLGR
jgi:glycosyltransferase involved in cell wall biosynthesis